MELRQIRYFVAVAEELHFRNAAQRLNISQPPLSRQIHQLEQDLKVALFVRSKRGISLTPAGRRLLPHARRILLAVTAASKAARIGEVNKITIGFVSSASVLLPPILRKIREDHPEIELRMIEASSARQGDMLRAGELDIALLRGPWANAGFVTDEVAHDKLSLILASDHPLAARPDLRLADLAAEPIVFFPRELGPGFFDTVMGACNRAGFAPEMNQIAGSTLTMIALVAAGQGFSLVPSRLAAVAKGVAVFDPPDLDAITPLLAVYHEERKDTEPTQSVVASLKALDLPTA